MEQERFEELIAALEWKKLVKLPRKVEIGIKILKRECNSDTELKEFKEIALERFDKLCEAMEDSLYNYPKRFGHLGDDTIIDGLWGIIPLGWDAYQKVLQTPSSFWSFYKDARQMMQTESFAYIVDEIATDNSDEGFQIINGEGIIPEGTKQIDDYSFQDHLDLKRIVIPNSVTSIGSSAFSGCKNLESVTIPESVTSIGSWAFSSCENLKSIKIPESVTCIEAFVFYKSSGLTSVKIPNSVTSIKSNAFDGCSGLTSVIIPDNVNSMGDWVFSGCSGLTSVTIPKSVTSIGFNTFYGCSGLTSIHVERDNTIYDSRNNCNAIIETSSNTLIAGCAKTTIPTSVTIIGDHAFCGCCGLTSINIPFSVTRICFEAFSQCNGLKSVTIPNSVTLIEDMAFSLCKNLTSVEIDLNVTSIGRLVFYGTRVKIK